MTPQQTLKEINEFIGVLVELGLSDVQNFPVTLGRFNSRFEITVSNAAGMTVALKNVAYRDTYTELDKAGCFNIKMLDGALITFRYRFRDGRVCEHSLTYFPSPDLEQFQNEPDLYLNDDEVYADIIARNIVPFPVRFDFCDEVEKFVEVHHSYSHLTLGQYKNCRIPVSSPLGPFAFGGFILRSFYNTAFRKYSDNIPVSSLGFDSTITAREQKVPHFVCGT